MIDRQASVAADDQLLDDLFDRIVEVDAVDVVARHQDVIDGDLVQGQQTLRQVQAVVGLVIIVIAFAAIQFVQGHGMWLNTERAQEHPGAAIEQPGQWLEQLQRHFEQAVAQADECLRVASGQLSRQVFS
ncbi:hypothetical protein D3C77_549680 [compost metagenome]